MSSPSPMYPVAPRRSIAGPVLLVLFGALLLLRNFGLGAGIFHVLAHWWPLLLVFVGVIRLWEYYDARRAGQRAARLGPGATFLIFFLIMGGVAFHNFQQRRDNIDWGEVRDHMDIDDDFLGLFGSSYNFSGESEQTFPANSALHIASDRGNITLNSWDQPNVKVVFRKRVFASSQDEANKINGGSNPMFSIQGNVVLLNANTEGSGSHNVANDMDVFLPRKAAVEISARRGDIDVSGREGDLKLSVSKGDVSVSDLNGSLTVSIRGGSFRADKVTGSVNANGRFEETSLSDIGGPASLNGEFFGELHLSRLAKGVSFHSSRTDLEIAKIDGDLDMSSGDLRGSQIAGPVAVKTRAYDIDLQNLAGDVKITQDTGDVSLQTSDKLPMGNVEVATKHGDVRIGVPQKASFRLNASTRHGDIQTDNEFGGLKINRSDNLTTASGSVGGGSAQVQVTSESGDIEVRRNGSMPTPPTPPAPPSLPKAPKVRGTPKLPAPPSGVHMVPAAAVFGY